MRAYLVSILTVAVLVIQGCPVAAQEDLAPRALSPEDLLDQIRKYSQMQQDEDKRREAEFRERKAEQQGLLAEAQTAKAAVEERSAALEKTFDSNETVLRELQETFQDRVGTLGELFGVVRQVAASTLGYVEDSLISAQLPGREQFLKNLAKSRHLPSSEELERLWIVLQEEMTESGKVTRFSSSVVDPGGKEREREVVRIGPFNAISEGRYLQYLPETRQLAELPRQPAARHRRSIARFEEATDGVVGVSIDPSRGSILSLLIVTPSLRERIRQGGIIGYVIIVLGLGGLVLGFQRLVYLGNVGRRVRAQIGRETVSDDNPLGRVIEASRQGPEVDLETIEHRLDEAILRETPALETGNTLIRAISLAAPLLGLLGTVTGMIQTFQAITLFGTGDPKLMAGGISQALVTTVLGLTVAIPLLLLHTVVSSRSKALVQILEEESAGIVTHHAERIGSGG